MRQRVLRGLKQQDQCLGAGFGYLVMIRPLWMEAQLRRHREVRREHKRWRKSRHGRVQRGRRVRPFISRIEVDTVASVRKGQVDVELHQFHCSKGIMVPGGEDSEPYIVGTVLDNGAGISCVSEVTVCALQKRFPGVDVAQPFYGEQHQVVLADGRAAPIGWQTCSLTATIMTPWAPVTIRLALAVMPGENDSLIIGSKTLREKLSIDVMKQLRDTAAVSGGGASSTDRASAEVAAMPPEVIGVRRMAVTMKAMQQVADIEVETAGETDGFKDALLDGVPKLMMGSGDSETEQREQILKDAVWRATQAGMPPSDVAELRRLVLGHYEEAFHRGLTGEPPAQVEPTRVVWTPTARTMKANPTSHAP